MCLAAHLCCSKSRCDRLITSVLKDMGPIGVTINAVAPGTVMSGDRISGFWANKSEEDKAFFFKSNPSGRLGVPKDIARTIVFLCHEDASYINGAVIDVNGGMWVG